MGGLAANGGMWPDQASADDLRSLDEGAPVSLASESSFVPLLVSPTPMGNSEADSQVRAARSPAQFNIYYMGPTGVASKHVPFREGLSLKHYLRDSELMGMRMRYSLVVGGRRVRMSYVPRVGESLTLAPPMKPLLSLGK